MVSDERGTTFIEILVAMVIMSTVVIAVIAGMSAATASSGTHRRQAEAHNILVAAVERVRSNDEVAYKSCATNTEASYLAAARAVSLPSVGFDANGISIDDIQYWQYPSTSGNPAFASTPCKDNDVDSSGNHIYRLQLITLKVQTKNGGVSEKLQFIKAGE